MVIPRAALVVAVALGFTLPDPASAQVTMLSPSVPQLGVYLGRTTSNSNEVQFRWHGDTPVWTGFRPVAGLSLSDQGEGWVGAGLSVGWQFGPQQNLYGRVSVLPGFHAHGRGPDIGGSFHFRSSLEIGYRLRNGGSVVLMFDHRSNAGLRSPNPGLDTVSVGYTISLR